MGSIRVSTGSKGWRSPRDPKDQPRRQHSENRHRPTARSRDSRTDPGAHRPKQDGTNRIVPTGTPRNGRGKGGCRKNRRDPGNHRYCKKVTTRGKRKEGGY